MEFGCRQKSVGGLSPGGVLGGLLVRMRMRMNCSSYFGFDFCRGIGRVPKFDFPVPTAAAAFRAGLGSGSWLSTFYPSLDNESLDHKTSSLLITLLDQL